VKQPKVEQIEVNELQILLNMIGPEFVISYPMYNFDLFRAKVFPKGYKLKVTCEEANFERQRSMFGVAAKELPSYSDFRGGLICSSILPMKNIDEFKKKLLSFHNLSKDVKYSLDTNLLYYRFVSNYGLLKPAEIVLVKTVGDEIKAKLNHKYNPYQLNELKKHSKFQKHLFDELWNRRKKRSRKASYIALLEYKMIMEGVADELREAKRSSNDSSDNDKIIVKTLGNFEKEGHTLPVLLTADDSVADLCNAEGLEYFKFDLPHAIEANECTAKQLISMIFNMAVVFGFVKVNSVVIFGEFRGKTSNKPDELKLEFLNNEIIDEFRQDLKICRRLMDLGIKR
jgi:hypothetical protein